MERIITRICRTCERILHDSAFYKDSRYAFGDIHCKDCRKAKVKAWRDANKERAKEIQKRSRDKNPEAARKRARDWHSANRAEHLQYMAERRKTHSEKILCSKLRSAYGISFSDYESILEKQKGACSICGKDAKANRKRLAVDHCHKTKKVRGLLCSKCNQAIGLLDDSIINLRSAIKYLSKHQSKNK